MLILAKFLANILSILNSEVSPRQIAAGFAWGVLIGLLPISGLLPYVLLSLAFIVNINLAAMALAAAVFKLVSFVIDPVANAAGYSLLTAKPLHPLWTKLINMPVVPFTRFNNTLVTGSLAVGLVLLVPAYLLSKNFVVHYRTRYRDRILKWKIVQIFKSSTLYQYYESFQRARGQ